MTTSELADYLRLNERTVLKLASRSEIPGVRLGNQWRFRRSVIDAWLDDQMLGLRRKEIDTQAERTLTFEFDDLVKAVPAVTDLVSTRLSRVLEEISARAADLRLVRDKTWFFGALLEREHVLSSGMGDGVAFPHTLERHPEQIPAPFLLFGRSLAGIDFEAPDNRPVHLLVVMGLRYQALHLPWLQRLSTALRRADLRSGLLSAETSGGFNELLRASLSAD